MTFAFRSFSPYSYAAGEWMLLIIVKLSRYHSVVGKSLIH